MHKALHPHSPWRIFAVSSLVTLVSVVGVLLGKGAEAMFVTLVLIAVELAFSFDNAIVNTKVLKYMSSFWQTMFLTIGALLAIFGMRLVFPIVLVAITAGMGWREVLDLALNHPLVYAEKLKDSHVELSAFAGGFLLMLALHFFIDDERKVLWLKQLERSMQRVDFAWVPTAITTFLLAAAALMPFNHEKQETIVAGVIGILIYGIIHWLNKSLSKMQKGGLGSTVTRAGLAGFISFIYLQILDATFSFDGVLGAFAVTNDIILIAVGLGVGAMWVRSLTVFMVRRGTLDSYLYIEHGAYYTIGILAVLLLVSIFVDVPELMAGLIGAGIIGASIVASRQALKRNR
jgi:hypothetical protein